MQSKLRLLVPACLLAASLNVQAVILDVHLDFAGTVFRVTNSNFSTLAPLGSSVSGSIEFDVDPSNIRTTANSATGSYSVASGVVSGFSMYGLQSYGNATGFHAFYRDGTGPKTADGQYMLTGLGFDMAFPTGIDPNLDPQGFLAQTTFSSFRLVGRIPGVDSGGQFTVEEVALDRYSFRQTDADVPEPGTMSLAALALIGWARLRHLGVNSSRRQSRVSRAV